MPTARVLQTQPAYSREFDGYCHKLKNLSERAASYMLNDQGIKAIYRENIREAIKYLRDEFYRKRTSSESYQAYLSGRDNAFNGLIYLYECEEADYQRARRKDWSIYEITAKFEENPGFFYLKKGAGIVGGIFQFGGGFATFKIGKAIRSGTLQGIGVLAMTTGGSNAIEDGSALIYEWTKGKYGKIDNNILQNSMADVAAYAGFSRHSGELTYKTIDFSIGMFLSFGMLVKLKNPNRLLHLPVETRNGTVYPGIIERFFGEKGGFFLFHALRSDFVFKVQQMTKPAFWYYSGMTGYKAKILISEYKED
ncbi:DUF4225 domain-containing protein [Morganella morganii]|uniref:DUF4225 domain-containing protein n=1 Tax=Morganella morganii TaxID=582 RepID=UPI0028D2FDE6|nr:DUF4225 domain-containing protein [Morganella morganii]WNP30602.1 DUF4225 domain-containing protein [Morganella morganii]